MNEPVVGRMVVTVVPIRTADTYDLRRRVLRSGVASTDVVMAGDDDPATFHLGATISPPIRGNPRDNADLIDPVGFLDPNGSVGPRDTFDPPDTVGPVNTDPRSPAGLPDSVDPISSVDFVDPIGGSRSLLVGVSSWMAEPHPHRSDESAYRLRGMAADPAYRGIGIGATLVAAGALLAAELGARLLWAQARDTALGFYVQFGWELDGDGFVDATTGLPHHRIVRDLTASSGR